MRELRNAAVELASRGWHIFPLGPRSKIPLFGSNGYLNATDDLVETFLTWQRHPAANVGVACGPSGLIVIDVDPRNDGDLTFANAVKVLGPLPQTVEVVTGGGGMHYYLRHPGGSLRGKLGEGVEIKDLGHVLAPPSIHPEGGRYEWSVDGHPDEVEVASLPDEWLDKLRVATRPASAVAEPGAYLQSPDPLRRIPAATYITKLTGRTPDRNGFYQCPIHKGGQERTPSLDAHEHMWACYGCEAPPGSRAMGGNIYDFAALLLDLPIPLRGADYLETKAYLVRMLNGSLS